MIIKEIFATLALLILYVLYRISHFFILTRRIDTFTDWINTDRRDDFSVMILTIVSFLLILFFGFVFTILIYAGIFALNLIILLVKRLTKI
jgi:hypothetical protein